MGFDNETFTWATDWKESVDSPNTPSADDVFGRGESQSLLTGQVPFAKGHAFVKAALGYSYVELLTSEGTGEVYARKLRRSIGAFHPIHQYMYANGCTLRGYAPAAALYPPSPPPPLAPPRRLMTKRDGLAAIGAGPDYSAYTYFDATISFHNANFDAYDDATMDEAGLTEDERFTFFASEGNLEIVDNGLNVLEFCAGMSTGKPIPGGGGSPVFKERVTMTWLDVPKDYLCHKEKAVKLVEGQGCVNRTDFQGYEAGTLLYTGFKRDKRVLPLVTDTDGDLYSYDVGLEMLAFDPPRLPAYSPSGSVKAWKVRGHNLVPSPGDRPYWVPAAVDHDLSKPTAFASYEFRDLFKHWEDASDGVVP